MKPKKIVFGRDARQKILRGVQTLEKAVACTLGPKGRNVVIGTYGRGNEPIITKDGVTVAEYVVLEDPEEDLGAQLVRQAAQRTADACGDGTSTATVLARALIESGLSYMDRESVNTMEIRRGMEAATADVLAKLEKQTVKISITDDALKQVAVIATNQDQVMGDLIAEAYAKVTEYGVITVESTDKGFTFVETTLGMSFDRGFIHPGFANQARRPVAEYQDDVMVLVTDLDIYEPGEIEHVVADVFSAGKTLLVIANSVADIVRDTLLVYKSRGLKVVVTHPPGHGAKRKEILEDIAVAVGGTLVSKDRGMRMRDVTEAHVGLCERVIVDDRKTILIGGKGDADAIEARLDLIQHQLDAVDGDGDYHVRHHKQRLARMAGGIAVIKVGADTETAAKERRYRVEDAVYATRAALEEGVVKGGGAALLECALALSADMRSDTDFDKGYGMVVEALILPFTRIMENAGYDVDVYTEYMNGYDATTGEVCDMFEKGILDPAKVTKTALSAAASIAMAVLTTECIINPIPGNEEKEEYGYTT